MRRGGFIACTWAVLVAATTPAWAGKSYKVAISTEPAGATVRIDDPDADPEGQTPCELELAPGPYMVILSLDGYQQRIEEITVKKTRKKQKFDFEMQAIPMAHLELVADGDAAEGASVRLDGKIAGQVPATIEVAEGPHELVVVKEGYRRFEKWIEVSGGADQSVSVALRPEGEETPVVVKKKSSAAPSRLGLRPWWWPRPESRSRGAAGTTPTRRATARARTTPAWCRSSAGRWRPIPWPARRWRSFAAWARAAPPVWACRRRSIPGAATSTPAGASWRPAGFTACA